MTDDTPDYVTIAHRPNTHDDWEVRVMHYDKRAEDYQVVMITGPLDWYRADAQARRWALDRKVEYRP